MPRAHWLGDAGEAPAVLLLIDDPDAPAHQEDLRAAFGLTPAEARLAALIGTGLGVP
jgi:hypothetical protein